MQPCKCHIAAAARALLNLNATCGMVVCFSDGDYVPHPVCPLKVTRFLVKDFSLKNTLKYKTQQNFHPFNIFCASQSVYPELCPQVWFPNSHSFILFKIHSDTVMLSVHINQCARLYPCI